MNGIENFPLKEKPTIENHDWCDPNIDTLNAEPTFNRERIVVTSDEYSYKIYKDDAIAIARHFGIIYDSACGGYHCGNCEAKAYG